MDGGMIVFWTVIGVIVVGWLYGAYRGTSATRDESRNRPLDSGRADYGDDDDGDEGD